ncbi:MAG TPA: DUF418 domain-containing protein [Candidatus Koribacter sp.]|jgi:uncharacterized protein
MQADVQRAGPVSLSERILFIDVLRGMALFGILAANIRAFFAPIEAYGYIQVLYPGRADVIAQWFVDAFIQVKFITIFSFLFGMGFAIQMSRAEEKGAKFLSFYPRRLLALALFGIIHGILIWGGDILLTYALSGAILLLFRKRQQKTLLWWAGSLFSLPIMVNSVLLIVWLLKHPKRLAPDAPNLQKIHDIVGIYAHGPVSQMLAQNWKTWIHELPVQLFAIYAFALFALGMWTWRSGIVQNLDRYKPVLKKVCAWCLPIGLALNFFIATANSLNHPGQISYMSWAAQAITLVGAHILSAGYISGLALIFLDGKKRRYVVPFAAVGRMALTDYLMQSVCMTLLFYHYTTGLYGRVGPAIGWSVTIVFFSAQVVFSNWWLKSHRFGPMEWLWRGMTYGKFPSMTKDEPPSLVEPSATPVTMAAAASAVGEEKVG